jgi:sigma-B regulation protein RsbU (phosphoserine phosphatase)
MGLIALLCILVRYGMIILKPFFYQVYRQEYYLTFHTMLEFASVLMAFSIFPVAFYTFQRSKCLRTLIVACLFLMIGLLDAFHTLSYKGMPDFFTFNCANKATTFWIIGRLITGLGLMLISWMPSSWTAKMRGIHHLMITGCLAICGYFLYIVAFRRGVIPPMFIEGQGLTPLKIYLEYTVMALLALAAFFYLLRFRRTEKKVYAWMVMGLVVSIASEVAFTQYANVYDTYNLLGHLYKMIAFYIFFKAFFVANVQQPYDELAAARREVQHYADHLLELVDLRTQEISEANKKLLQDIDYARSIQMALLPSSFPEIEGLGFASRYIPCERIGGDFYNVVRLDDENVGIYFGDVAGHGVSAAMITVFLNQSIKMKRVYDDGSYKLLPPREVLLNLYHVYNRTEFPEEIYMVMLYGLYHIPTRTFTYSSGGMNVPMLLKRGDGSVEKVETNGFPICKFGDHYKPMYENHPLQLAPGDTLVFFMDGLTEVHTEDLKIFTSDDLVKIIGEMPPISEMDMAEEILGHYYRLLGSREMIDDVTLLIMGIHE